jgi:hypothetical protein
MTLRKLLTLLSISLTFPLMGCESEEDKPPVVEYVKLNVEAPGEGEGGAVVMTTAMCTSDSDTGFFQGDFTGDDGSLLTVKIKGFTTSEAIYTCTQASDNTAGEVGNKFDSCSVALVIADPETSVNSYAMHRSSAEVKGFTYGGTCTVTTSYSEPTLTADVNCTGLVQTDLQGAARNPIDESITASITSGSTFSCDL